MNRTSICLLPLLTALLASQVQAGERVTKDGKGRIHCEPLPTESRFLNPWTPELEGEFWDRANTAIRANSNKGYGGLFFESEKRSYQVAMMDFLAGNRQKALDFLQQDDSEGYNKYTLMVDFYPCFTLRSQMRKYFFFGQYLDDAYRKKMYEAAKIWTATDPLTRKHPLQAKTKPGQGFMPEATGVCVDTRNTDNLQAMRETAVYLMAEETGNEAVRKIYADRLIRNVENMYRVGMGEWDSNNYHGHTMTGYIQLYDFAKDPKMKLIGKAAMDYLCAVGAVKYYRGGFGGPSKRDYNHPIVHSGSAADQLGLYFGDYPGENEQASYDNVQFITSAYRPPLAVVALARKEFPRPAEVFATHPSYDALRKGAAEPQYFETMYFGQTFNLGTLAQGSDGPGDDVNGFKLTACNSDRGVDFFIPNTATNPEHICSAQYGQGDTFGGNNVAQFRNLAIWLNGKADCPFIFLLPKSAKLDIRQEVVFIALQETWLALHPIHLKVKGIDARLTEQCNYSVQKGKGGKETRSPKWPLEQILAAEGTGQGVCGFALEAGERATHGDFVAFKQVVSSKGKLDLAAVAEGIVEYSGASGDRVKIKYAAAARPGVWRNGEERPWTAATGQHVPVGDGSAPIRCDWNSGKLHVEAGGYTFDGAVDNEGTYTFRNGGK